MNIISVKPFTLVFVSALFSGCASMPEVELSYYLPKSKVNITVTQTIMCMDPNAPIVTTNVEFTSVYFADVDKPKTIDYDLLDTWYSSGDATITLTADGRLKSFNSSSTGSGTDVVDTIITVVGATKSLGLAELAAQSKAISDACDIVNKMAGKSVKKPNPVLSVVITSVATFDKNPDGKPESKPVITHSRFKLKGYSESTYLSIVEALGPLSFKYNVKKLLPAPKTDNDNKQSITVVEPASVDLSVIWKGTDSLNSTFTNTVFVPQLGTEYKPPIPNPPFFGKNELELSLHKSGKISKLRYGTTGGVKDTNSTLARISSQFKEESATNAEIAADLKAQSDIIKQQQRLIKCEADRVNCE